MGLGALWQQRAVALCVSALTAWLVLLFMAYLTRSRLLGVLGALFYTASLPFAELADGINSHAYMQFTAVRLSGVLAGVRAERPRSASALAPTRRRLLLSRLLADVRATYC